MEWECALYAVLPVHVLTIYVTGATCIFFIHVPFRTCEHVPSKIWGLSHAYQFCARLENSHIAPLTVNAYTGRTVGRAHSCSAELEGQYQTSEKGYSLASWQSQDMRLRG